MTRRMISLMLVCACGLGAGGCASIQHGRAAAASSAAPPADTAATPAPAAVSGVTAATSANESATPIPDLNDNSPLIQWEGLSIAPAQIKYDNLWDYLGKHFTLSTAGGDGRVQGELNWYADHGAYLQRMANRARPYLYYIVQQVKAHNMPLDIALLPIVESAYDPYGYSVARAAGLWQFIPDTGRHWDLKQNWWYDGRRDVVASTRAALDYLQFLHAEFHDDWLLALAAYNSGGGTVQRAIDYNVRRGLPTDFWHLDLPAQTRAYVPRLLAICKLVAAPEHYGVDLPPIPNKPYLAQVNVGGQIDLATAAKLAGISNKQMELLNPGFNRWATDPDGPTTLLVPLDKQQQFEQNLAALPPHERVRWNMHVVRSGDTLGGIARHYRTTVAVVRQLNGIRGNLIRVHQVLLVPVVRETLADATLVAEARVSHMRHHADYYEPGGRIVHHVRSGESLWTIARRYHVNVIQLAAWNRISRHSVLHVGQRLVIHRQQARVLDTAYELPAGAPKVQRVVYYTVRTGDSLYSISEHFNVSVADITGWNGINARGYLHAGERLKLYVNVTDQSTSS
jgi:membrane-bound lytic murein transglycosylase D